MGFLYVFSGLDAHELCHEAVEDVFVVLGLVGIGVVEQTEFKELRIARVVEGKEVGACFFKG